MKYQSHFLLQLFLWKVYYGLSVEIVQNRRKKGSWKRAGKILYLQRKINRDQDKLMIAA